MINNNLCLTCTLSGIELCNWNKTLEKFNVKIPVNITINSCPKFDEIIKNDDIEEDDG